MRDFLNVLPSTLVINDTACKPAPVVAIVCAFSCSDDLEAFLGAQTDCLILSVCARAHFEPLSYFCNSILLFG